MAGVAKLVDARDLGSRDESRGGSSPSARTTTVQPFVKARRKGMRQQVFLVGSAQRMVRECR